MPAGTLGPFGMAVEILAWTRFIKASLGTYLDVVPNKHPSGNTRSRGSVTKAGNSYVRHLLVEAARQHARPYHGPGVRLRRQFDLVSRS